MRGFTGLRLGQLAVVRQSFGESALRPQGDGKNYECGHIIQLRLKARTSACLSILIAARLQRMLEYSDGWKFQWWFAQKRA